MKSPELRNDMRGWAKMWTGHIPGLGMAVSCPSMQAGKKNFNAGLLRTYFRVKHIADLIGNYKMKQEKGSVGIAPLNLWAEWPGTGDSTLMHTSSSVNWVENCTYIKGVRWIWCGLMCQGLRKGLKGTWVLSLRVAALTSDASSLTRDAIALTSDTATLVSDADTLTSDALILTSLREGWWHPQGKAELFWN